MQTQKERMRGRGMCCKKQSEGELKKAFSVIYRGGLREEKTDKKVTGKWALVSLSAGACYEDGAPVQRRF